MTEPKAKLRESASRRGRDYGYSNARVRGMRSRLLTRQYLDQLMGCFDLRGVIQMLTQTEYGPDLEVTLLHGHTFAAVDDALKENLVRTSQKILRFVNGEAHHLVVTLLGRWDLFNVKTIIRGKHMHLSTEEIRDSLIGVGQLSAVELRALADLEDVRAVVDTLNTWGLPYGHPLRDAMGEYLKERQLSILELALDKYYSQWAAGQLKGRRQNYRIAREVLGLQTDATNVLTVFRLLKADMEGTDVGEFFLPGGAIITEQLFRDLASVSDIDEVLEKLKSTPYGKPLGEAAILYLETNSIATLERVLEDYVMKRTLAVSHGDPLGAGVVISYLWAKQNEVTNLRIIVKGNSVGMPPERVRRELILV
jgi:V/A-type H+-transporting ATPase subunit C